MITDYQKSRSQSDRGSSISISSSIIGKAGIKSGQWVFLKNKFEAGQLGHAYLLSGSVGTEKFKFAKKFVKLINCLNNSHLNHRSPFFHTCEKMETSESSHLCQNCKMVEKESFPDLIVIRSADSESSIKNKKDMMAIEIDQMREVQNFLSYKSYYGGYKSVIIENAERMTIEAQHCFLKSLEEPKGNTIIFLLAAKTDLLLPTIVSRCQEIKFLPKSRCEFSTEEQKILKDFLNVAESDLATKFQYAKKANLEEGELSKMLEIFLRYLRDLLLFKIGVTKTMEQSHFLNHYSIDKLKNIIKRIENINHQLTTTNVNPRLALEVVLMEL